MSRFDSGRRLGRAGAVAMLVAAVPLAAASEGSASGLSGRAATRPVQPNAGPASGRVLGGFTSQRWPIVVAISKNGGNIQMIGTGLVLTCSSGDSFPIPDRWEKLAIHTDGAVRAAVTIPASPSGSGPSITGGSDTLTGRMNRRRATFTGVWQLHLTLLLQSGQTDQCDSGLVTFTTRM
jgi:hypothetical protein